MTHRYAITVFVILCGLCCNLMADSIVNRQSDKSLDANSTLTAQNGCPVHLWDYLAQPQQNWRFVPVGEGFHVIVCGASGLVLEANSDRVHENGCPIQLWQLNGWHNQQWRMVPVPGTDGGIKLVNRASGKVLDAHAYDVHLLNCRVQLWDDLNQPQQLWIWKPDQTPVANLGINSGKTDVSQRLRVLLISDTNTGGGISKGVKADQQLLLKVLNELAKDRPHRFTIDVLEGDQVSPQNIKEYYERLTIKPGDALFCYYSGHGGWDIDKRPNKFDEKGHYLAMSSGNLYRSDLRSYMAKHEATAHFLITDACSSVVGVSPPPRRTPAEWSGFQNLFFGHSGFYDIQGATRLEFGWSGDDGGLFTGVFAKLLCEPHEHSGWNHFFQKLREDTVDHFKQTQAIHDRRNNPRQKPFDIRDVEAQTPEALYLGDWPGSPYRNR